MLKSRRERTSSSLGAVSLSSSSEPSGAGFGAGSSNWFPYACAGCNLRAGRELGQTAVCLLNDGRLHDGRDKEHRMVPTETGDDERPNCKAQEIQMSTTMHQDTQSLIPVMIQAFVCFQDVIAGRNGCLQICVPLHTCNHIGRWSRTALPGSATSYTIGPLQHTRFRCCDTMLSNSSATKKSRYFDARRSGPFFIMNSISARAMARPMKSEDFRKCSNGACRAIMHPHR